MARIRVGLLPTSSFMVGTLPVPKYADQEKTQFATPQLDDVDPVFRVGRNNAQPAKPKRAGDGCDASGGRHMAHGNNLGQIGAGEGIRTLDPDLGKVVLYP